MPARGRPQTITDDELLDAARAVFLEQAVGATTAAIAKKARVSESVIFHRYKTKETLFLAVFDREARVPAVLENLTAKVGKGDVSNTLFDIAMGVIEQTRAMIPFFMVASTMARASHWRLDVLKERMRRPTPAHERATRLLARYLAREAELGRLRPMDSESLARIYLGAITQYVMQQYWWNTTDQSQSIPDFVRCLVDVLLLGLLPRPAAGRVSSARARH